MKTFKEIAITLQEAEELNEANLVSKITNKIKHIKTRTKEEGTETKEMMKVFGKSLKAKLKGNNHPTPEELKDAIKQLKDVGRITALIPIMLMPGSVITVTVLEKIAKKFDTTIFPN